MTSTSYYYDHGAGLSVSMPNVMYNIYYMNTDYKSKHFHYTMASGLLSSQGERGMPGGGHYGIVDTDDHKVMFSYWSSTSLLQPRHARSTPTATALTSTCAPPRCPRR